MGFQALSYFCGSGCCLFCCYCGLNLGPQLSMLVLLCDFFRNQKDAVIKAVAGSLMN